MLKTTTLLTLSAALLTAQPLAASPLASTKRDPSGPKIELIFFSDTACTTTVPSSIYTRSVYGDVACYVNPDQSFSSVQILSIDDQFIGTNTALQVGYTNGDTCDGFGESVKFDVSNADLVGQCQYIGIVQGQGEPVVAGNEYRLTSLEG